MSITFEKAGILTTLQDIGRYGYRRFGVNPSGVMDQAAARLINILLGDAENEAVLEMHFPAPQILFEENAIIAIGGGDFAPTLDGKRLQNWRPHFAKKGSRLKFQNKKSGVRAYLAVHRGFKTKTWLASASTNLIAQIGGYDGRKFEIDDRLALNKKVKRRPQMVAPQVSSSLLPSYGGFPTVRIIAGAEFNLLDNEAQRKLLDQNFTITSNSNRMGYRLRGEPVLLTKWHELVSVAVNFGAMQLLPDGQLIVLMADQQTSGGYPRIAHVVSRDLPLLAQLGASDKVAFHLISSEEAEQLALDFEAELNFFRVGCKFQTQSWNI